MRDLRAFCLVSGRNVVAALFALVAATLWVAHPPHKAQAAIHAHPCILCQSGQRALPAPPSDLLAVLDSPPLQLDWPAREEIQDSCAPARPVSVRGPPGCLFST